MSDTSARLALPYLQPAQAQKHVTHNEALTRLDALVQLSVEAFGATTPPASPLEGAVYGLGAAPDGDWTGQAGQLAAFADGGWLFFTPAAGWRAWDKAQAALLVFTGSTWSTVSGVPDLNNLPGLGVNTGSDPINRLAVAAAATLLTHEGAGHQVKVNKADPGDTASLLFQTGWSGRAEMGLAGNDDFSIKVSADGSGFAEALRIEAGTGRVEWPQAAILPGQGAAPAAPGAGRLAVYARNRAGAPWLDVMRPSGRDFPLQPHFGVNRIAGWAPSSGTTINTTGLPVTSVGTVATPTLGAGGMATSMRRWRVTSAATADAAADQRAPGWACWRGTAASLGGWTCVLRLSLTTLQPTGAGFFGLYGSTSALAGTLTLAAMVNCIGIGFQRGTHSSWQLAHNDATGAPSLTDLGAAFGIATGGVLTLYVAAAPNAATAWVRVVEETTGAVFEQEISADLPAAAQFLSPRLYLNNGGAAAAVAYDCAGLYLETDY